MWCFLNIFDIILIMELNNEFLNRMKILLGENFDRFKQSLNEPLVKAVYVNEHKISVEKFKEIVDFDISQIPYERAGFYVDEEKKGRHSLHHAGAFYMQEPSAMFTVNSISFEGNEWVLDMCAAPGGKSIQIANRIPKGVLVSNEIVKSRSEILFSNIERMGLQNVIVANDTPENIASAYGDCFDVCFVDAPCSGEGMFRRGDDVTKQWNESLEDMCALRQLEILEHADKTLKQGGRLVYSTCTYSKKENEDVVLKFLQTHNYKLQNINYEYSKGIDMPEAVRLYPHENKGEGQFVAVMVKLSENNNACYSGVKLTNSKITKDFIEAQTNLDIECLEFANYNYYVPCKDLVKKHVNYVSVGVRLGRVESNRFEPHHNLFTAFGNSFRTTINKSFKDVFVEKYLRGESVDYEVPDCYGALIVDGCPLGGFKISKGKLKNYYPKGLRNF